MKLWIVNPFDPVPGESFRPGRYATLAEMLLERGHGVTWFTSSFFHVTKSFRPTEYLCKAQNKNLKVIFVKTPPYLSNIGVKRIINHLAFARNFRALADSQIEKPDLILASAPPLSSAMASIKIAEPIRAKCVIDVQDLWPEVYRSIFPDGLSFAYKLLFYPFKKYADRVYDRAFALSAVSRAYLDRAVAASSNRKKSGAVIHLGIDLDLFRKTAENPGKVSPLIPQKLDGEFWATYVGTIGKSYDIITSIRAASILKKDKGIKFFFAGTGPQLQEMKARVLQMGLENVHFLGFLRYDIMVALLKESDVGLNIIETRAPHNSNKLFDYIAAGLPVINSLGGEFEELLQKKRIGLQYQAGDEHSLAAALLNLNENRVMCSEMGKRAEEIVKQSFDRHKSYNIFIDFLEKVAST